MTLEEANSEAPKEMRNAGEQAQALYNQWADAFSTALENSTSGQTDVDSDVQNQARNVDKYTEKEYNDFGWARANDVLTANESEELRSKFASAVKKHTKPPKTKSGEFMIALNVKIGNQYYENKIAYMKGTIRNPIITRIVEIDEYNETKLAEIRRELYETERRGVQQKTSGIFRRYNSFDFGRYEPSKRSVSAMSRHNNELGVDRGRSSNSTKKVVGGRINDDGSYSLVYEDGTSEISTQAQARRVTKEQKIQ